MTNQELMNTLRWQVLRWHIYERDHGKCRICSRPGMDTHHLSYQFGFFNPRILILVCRPCHLIWRGEAPHHLPEDHSLRSKLFQIAADVRLAREAIQNLEHKFWTRNEVWLKPLMESTKKVCEEWAAEQLANRNHSGSDSESFESKETNPDPDWLRDQLETTANVVRQRIAETKHRMSLPICASSALDDHPTQPISDALPF